MAGTIHCFRDTTIFPPRGVLTAVLTVPHDPARFARWR